MSYGQIHRKSQEQSAREIDAFVKAVAHRKWSSTKNKARRFGPWLLAFHRTIGPTWKPRLCVYPGEGWSLWWLWFEVARVIALAPALSPPASVQKREG